MSKRLIDAVGKERISSAKDILDDIILILERDLQANISAMRKQTNYEDPAWAYKQADFIGQQRAINALIELLTLDQRKHNG